MVRERFCRIWEETSGSEKDRKGEREQREREQREREKYRTDKSNNYRLRMKYKKYYQQREMGYKKEKIHTKMLVKRNRKWLKERQRERDRKKNIPRVSNLILE